MDKHEAEFEKLVEAFTGLVEAQWDYNARRNADRYDDGYRSQRYYDAYQEAAKKARLTLDAYILTVVARAIQSQQQDK